MGQGLFRDVCLGIKKITMWTGWLALAVCTGWVAFAVGLAILGSTAEVLTKYENKLFKHIFNWYFLIYLVINGSLALIFYVSLPKIASIMLSSDLSTFVDHHCWQRSMIAGLGYPFLLRSKIFNIKIGEKEVPIGLEAIYLALFKYLIDNTTRKVKSIERAILFRMIEKYLYDVATFEGALNKLIIQEKDRNVKERLRTEKDKMVNTHNWPSHDKCFALGIVILEIVGSEEEMEKLLSSIPRQGSMF